MSGHQDFSLQCQDLIKMFLAFPTGSGTLHKSRTRSWLPISGISKFSGCKLSFGFQIFFFKKTMPPKAKNNGKPKGKKPKSKEQPLIQDYVLECKYLLLLSHGCCSIP